MSHFFPSEAWLQAYQKALNTSRAYRLSASKWDQGAIALVIEATDDSPLSGPFCAWLDLEAGRCKAAFAVSLADARRARTIIRGPYPTWKRVVQGELDPVYAMLDGQLEVDGRWRPLLRYVRSAHVMVGCLTRVRTRFDDEADYQLPRAMAG